MTSNPALVAECGVIETHVSDHYLIYSVLNLKLPKPPPIYSTTRSYKHYQPNLLINDLSLVPWQYISFIDDVNDKVDYFNQIFLEVLEKHAPVKTKKIKFRQTPFVDQDIKELMRKRDQIHRIARRTGAASDWKEYKSRRDEVKRKLRESERSYVRNEMQKNLSNNAMWKVIRNCIPRKEVSHEVYSKDKKLLAEEFNDFFISVGVRAAEASKKLAIEYTLPFVQHLSLITIPESDELNFYPVPSTEILKIVQSFSSNKAPGWDKVTVNLIKDSLPSILPVLTELVNSSLMTSVFPSAWKKSVVTPILKEGDHQVANDNRPISLLPIVSKICERVALNQLNAYTNSNNRLTEHQSGNKRMHSTETLNTFLTDIFLVAMDSRQVSAVVLLDLSKAFDSLDHTLLLRKLRLLGLSRITLEWFRSYLTHRSQSVRIGCELSESRTTTHGVPQGSILGPALFNIYINDLPRVPKACSLESYVDDSKSYLSFAVKDIETSAYRLTEDLERIAAWCCHSSLLINPDKTKLLLLGTPQMLKRVPENFSVTLLGKKLFPVSSAKDLGVIFDASLSYDEHVTEVVSKCISTLCQINRVKHILDRKSLLMAINALVFTKLYYCSTIWANTSKANVKRLQSVQNFAARIVTGLRKFDHITPSLKELLWLPVNVSLRYRDITLAFKCINGLAPEYLSRRFIQRSQIHDRATRKNDMLAIPFYQTATGQRSFLYRAVKLWNDLPDLLKYENNFKNFKTALKSYLFEEFYNES